MSQNRKELEYMRLDPNHVYSRAELLQIMRDEYVDRIYELPFYGDIDENPIRAILGLITDSSLIFQSLEEASNGEGKAIEIPLTRYASLQRVMEDLDHSVLTKSARSVPEELAEEYPYLFVLTKTQGLNTKKIYLDFSGQEIEMTGCTLSQTSSLCNNLVKRIYFLTPLNERLDLVSLEESYRKFGILSEEKVVYPLFKLPEKYRAFINMSSLDPDEDIEFDFSILSPYLSTRDNYQISLLRKTF